MLHAQQAGIFHKTKIALVLAAACLLPSCMAANTPLQSAPDASTTETLVQKAERIHARTLVLDAHADIVLPETSKTYLASDGLSKVDPSKLRAGKVGAVVMSVAVGPGPRTKVGNAIAIEEANAKLSVAQKLASDHDEIAVATSASEMLQNRKNNHISLILGFQNARALGGDAEALDRYYNQGIRVFGLNHMGHNDFSDSSRPLYIAEKKDYEVAEEHGGLSKLGVAAIQRINALGGLIDVSQMSKAATLQTIKLSKAPVIASHSNVRALSNVSRNLSDEEIDAMGKTGGVIHVASFGAYLIDLSDPALLAAIRKVRVDHDLPEAYSYPYELYWEIPDLEKRTSFLMSMRDTIGPGSIDRMIDHIDFIVKRIGIDHVGIGTDFNHGGGVAGFNDASEAMNVTAGLVKRGYTADQIAKIWSGNFMRVFAEAERVGKTID
ncbi:dipeptidase [Parasphingorhabdus halotolerans]|uniref:Dipeptidase n=1 Tax=Parasphingorhabdus halotolerans TaxID=2725558 RepID=A0A6H2DJR7_9SPHN|nr:membrane dipeptidase [Parasphingorhabdus halotolerans]QJB68630.1 dipeptidase [Parasphingorhabdus halotolerans]